MKNRNFVNLNINPCKMCMPMGAVTAFKGIEKSMVILHGSQGCSTYIRRHMAGHYNEPIDIASSSLNERGTVYGGAANLKKGLANLIKLYNPEIIGIVTTCLAETIGEDISRIAAEFCIENKTVQTVLIPVSTPGYGGTQYEGYYAALCSIIRHKASDKRTNRINIIPGTMSPGDIRNIKRILQLYGVDSIILPDISETLDAPYLKEYRRLAAGGTPIADIEEMGGAAATIEIGFTVPEALSPGKILLEEFGVPLYRCPLPIGLENTDLFIKLLSDISGKAVPAELKRERGRLIDAMIDSHKYNGEGRAVIYGEPDLVYAVSRMCNENGIKPVLLSTGTQNAAMTDMLGRLLGNAVQGPVISDDTDFETIQKQSVELKANILIGNSDGRIITEKEGIPLVRIGFPIHDRVGGQRQVITGYNGTISFLDLITNTLIQKKHEGYRKSMYDRYYTGLRDSINSKNGDNKNSCDNELYPGGKGLKDISTRTEEHPCFGKNACTNARMHVPVVPACNIQCNYCNRKYDCLNESRPGVTSEILTPEQAAAKFAYVRERLDNLKVVGIAGPGDALADFEITRETFRLIRQIDPYITLCLSTNGLMLPLYADEIADMGISHVTVTVNAVDTHIASAIYRQVNYMGRKYEGIEAAELLISNQLEGIRKITSRGVICKVNIVMIKGINDRHIDEVVLKVKECGAFMTNIMPLIPVKGSAFEHIETVTPKELNEIRKRCESDLRQMYHCRQCRADALGMLGSDCSSKFMDFKNSLCKDKEGGEVPGGKSFKTQTMLFAVASDSGLLIDRHFGQVERFCIYRYENSTVEFVETRNALKYCTGGEDCDEENSRIQRIIKCIEDCNAVLALRIGYRPQKELEKKGIKVIQACGRIEEGILQAVRTLTEEDERLMSVNIK